MDKLIEIHNKSNNLYIVWIYKNANSFEILKFLEELEYMNNNIIRKDILDDNTENNLEIPKNDLHFSYIIKKYNNVESSMNFLKNLKFEETIIIVDGCIFIDFVKKFHESLKDIYIIPKIIIFSNSNRKFQIPKNIGYEKFYISEIVSSCSKIKSIISSKIENIERHLEENVGQAIQLPKIPDKLIFEEIKEKKSLILPMLYRALIDKNNTEDTIKFIESIYKEYKIYQEYNPYLGQINSIKDKNIPVEILSKYFIKIYTTEGNFYKKMKMDLLDDNNNNINLKSFQFYIRYIKILYEGLETEALKTYVGNELYSAQLLSEEQVQCLVQSKKNRVTNDLPMSILYSKSFLSFSKVKSEAENFMNNKNAMLTVIKSENKYDLLTHADIEDISDFKKEREVLFFPLSVFGIDDFTFDESNNRYELKLIY